MFFLQDDNFVLSAIFCAIEENNKASNNQNIAATTITKTKSNQKIVGWPGGTA